MASLITPTPGYELLVDVDHQWTQPGPGDRVLDPDWRTVDSNGHGHFAEPKDSRTTLPTVQWISVPCTMGHGEDCDAEGDYHCKVCGEVVEPGLIPAKPKHIGTTRSFTLTREIGGERVVYRFGDEQWAVLADAFHDAVEANLVDFVVEREFASR